MSSSFDIKKRRAEFPILQTHVKGNPLVYLDNAASTQKPRRVIDTIQHFYLTNYSNVHRGIYTLSETASELFEAARSKVQQFIGAALTEEIVFTKGTTESINLVAQSYLRPRLKPKDEIIISEIEHHANIVPWQQLCEQTGACLKVMPMDPNGSLQVSALEPLLNKRTRLIALTHLSNVLGTLSPLKQIIACAHAQNIPVLIDGAQAVSHLPITVSELDCDFYTFSGHKIYGPSGVGVLYAKIEHLDSMPPWQTGGGMVQQVTFKRTDYLKPPHRFEAGTPAIAEVIGLGAAIDYLNSVDWSELINYEADLFEYATHQLETIPTLTLFAREAEHRLAVLSFTLDKVHAHDVATILNESNVAVRAGHHCAMPLMERLNVSATVRVSLGLYNTYADIDKLAKGLGQVLALLG